MSLWKDVASFLVRVSQLRYHLQGLGRPINDFEETIYVLNEMSSEWRNFAPRIYSKKDSTPFDELWAQCILEESRIKVKDDIRSDEQS